MIEPSGLAILLAIDGIAGSVTETEVKYSMDVNTGLVGDALDVRTGSRTADAQGAGKNHTRKCFSLLSLPPERLSTPPPKSPREGLGALILFLLLEIAAESLKPFAGMGSRCPHHTLATNMLLQQARNLLPLGGLSRATSFTASWAISGFLLLLSQGTMCAYEGLPGSKEV